MSTAGNILRDYFYQLVGTVGALFNKQASDPLAGATKAPRIYYNSGTDTFNAVDDGGFEYPLTGKLGYDAPITVPVVLSKHTNGSIAARLTPGFKGTIRKITALVTDPVTTGAKLATFTAAVATVATTGGALALTSANCTPVGAKVNGSAITAGAAFGATDEITVVASGVTAFVEGQVVLYLFLDEAA